MPYINPELVSKARQMDLLTYLQEYEPQELVPFGSNTYCTREHDSLKISNGKWHWFSRGYGGRSALDYLIKVKNIPFLEAVNMILERTAQTPSFSMPTFKPNRPNIPKELTLPKASRTNDRIIHYLEKRGIDRDIIDFAIQTGRIYESEPYHNVVFVGMDENNNPRYASLRGAGTDFVGEVLGSDKRYSFGVESNNGSNTLHLFESAIDLLSFATLVKSIGRDWKEFNLLSLAGVYKAKDRVEDTPIPLALSHYLDIHPDIDNVFIRFDNDETGIEAANTLKILLEKKYAVKPTIRLPLKGKDMNDYLCITRHLPVTKRRERSVVRSVVK